MVVGRILFLVGCWRKDLGFSLAIGWEMPSLPHHMGLSIGKLTTQ
jgi:hypothetical protein